METTFVKRLEEGRSLHFILQNDRLVFIRTDTSPLGYASEEILGSTLRSRVPPECFEGATDMLHDVLKTRDRKTIHSRTLGLAKDGSKIPVRVAIWATTYQNRPAVGGVMALITDETSAASQGSGNLGEYERLGAESAKAGEGITVFQNAKDKAPLCIYANDEIERLSGYSASELMGLKPSDLFKMSDDSGREIPDARFETEILRKDGGTTPVEVCIGVARLRQRGQVVIIYARDISERKAWEVKTIKLQEDLRFYASQVVKAQEEERKRLARELHDGTIQTLAVIADKLRMSERVSHDSTDDLGNMLAHALRELRSITWSLRPPFLDDQGLTLALEWLVYNVSKGSGLEIDFAIEGEPRRLPANIELSIFRIAQEAINNVYRHAKASMAEVILEFADDRVVLSISDNGCGFEIPDRMTPLVGRGKLGLVGMHERCQDIGAKIKIKSEPGGGTRIRVDMPTSGFSH